MNTTITQEFLTRCFALEETVAVLLRKGNPATTTQRVVRLEQMVSSRYLAWLRYENHAGANVYVGANPLRPGSRKRTKECVAEVRHLYIDIDMDGANRIAALKIRMLFPFPASFSRHHRTSIRPYGGLKIRLRPAGDDTQITCSHLWGRLCVHRPEPGTSRPRIPQLQVQPCSPSNRRISQHDQLSARGLQAGRSRSSIGTSRPRNPNSHIPAARTAILSRIGCGSFSSFPKEPTPGSSRLRLLPRGLTNPILFTTRNARSTWLPLVLLCSTAWRLTR